MQNLYIFTIGCYWYYRKNMPTIAIGKKYTIGHPCRACACNPKLTWEPSEQKIFQPQLIYMIYHSLGCPEFAHFYHVQSHYLIKCRSISFAILYSSSSSKAYYQFILKCFQISFLLLCTMLFTLVWHNPGSWCLGSLIF